MRVPPLIPPSEMRDWALQFIDFFLAAQLMIVIRGKEDNTLSEKNFALYNYLKRLFLLMSWVCDFFFILKGICVFWDRFSLPYVIGSLPSPTASCAAPTRQLPVRKGTGVFPQDSLVVLGASFVKIMRAGILLGQRLGGTPPKWPGMRFIIP